MRDESQRWSVAALISSALHLTPVTLLCRDGNSVVVVPRVNAYMDVNCPSENEQNPS